MTRKTLEWRWSQHVKEAKAARFQTVFYRSIRKYGADQFCIEPIYEAVDGREAQMVERALIAQYGTLAPLGMNTSTGGESHAGRASTPEVRARISRAKRGVKLSPEVRALVSAANKARNNTPEFRAFMSKTIKAQMADPVVRADRTRALVAHNKTPEHREFASALFKRLWQDPEWRGRRDADRVLLIEKKREMALERARNRPPKSKHLAMLSRWQNEAYRQSAVARLNEMSKDTGRRQRLADRNRARRGEKQSPERVAARIVAVKETWLRKREAMQYGAPTATVRAMVRSLPTTLVPRSAA